jgi:hypothetical protein
MRKVVDESYLTSVGADGSYLTSVGADGSYLTFIGFSRPTKVIQEILTSVSFEADENY